jgi:hypothetical protein
MLDMSDASHRCQQLVRRCQQLVKLVKRCQQLVKRCVTAIPGFFSYDYDAVCAFISAPLPVSERVYMKAVPGYPLEDDECLELHYTIYGLKQSS